MEEKEIRKCDEHCERCNINQRTYCAAQMALYNQKEIAQIKAILTKKEPLEVQTNIGINKVSENEEEEALD